jgi:hypothetical protein
MPDDRCETMAAVIQAVHPATLQPLERLGKEFPDARVHDWAFAFCLAASSIVAKVYGKANFAEVLAAYPEVTVRECLAAFDFARRTVEARIEKSNMKSMLPPDQRPPHGRVS